MSDSGESPSSSPPAPPADSSPPPDKSPAKSAPPPANSSPPSPPAKSSPPSPPPPDSKLPPPPSSPPPPAESTPSPPPPTSTKSPSPPPPTSTKSPSPPPPTPTKSPSPPPPTPTKSPSPPPPKSTKSPSPPPPANSETPPAPPNESNNNPPPSPDVQPPPPPSSSPVVGPKKPDTPPSPSPPPPPTSDPTNSPPAPPSNPTKPPPIPLPLPFDPTKPPPIPPPGPVNAPPVNPSAPPSPFHTVPPKTASGGPVLSPPLTVPSEGTPSSNEGYGDGYQGKTMVGMAVASVTIMAFIAVVFIVRRKKKRSLYNIPYPNFTVKPDGFYGQDPGKGNSGHGGSVYHSQHSSPGTSFGSQRVHYQQATPDSAILGSGKTHFSYEELAEITQGFSRQNILGEGGFGCVYKGTLQDGKVVAVKQLKAGSGQGDREFKAEVEIISRVHHRHLVSLVGYCISDQHRLLIYEFVPNQTLDHHLHGNGMPVLEWSKRVRIAIGSAKGLAYLHEDCHPKIFHRDIKSANILLDDEFEAQVADFGLARLNDTTQTHVSTRVMGTFGYLAPEYASSGKLTDRSDVFSFGVVLLELVTGRKPVDQNQPLGEESLVEWARPLLLKAIETGDFSELIDSRLEKHYVEHEVFRMIETAAACVRHSAPKRPRMLQVVRALDCDGDSRDINNGIKVGQSTAYDSGQYNEDIMNFRKMAFGFNDTSETGMYSEDYSDFSGNESEARLFVTNRFK